MAPRQAKPDPPSLDTAQARIDECRAALQRAESALMDPEIEARRAVQDRDVARVELERAERQHAQLVEQAERARKDALAIELVQLTARWSFDGLLAQASPALDALTPAVAALVNAVRVLETLAAQQIEAFDRAVEISTELGAPLPPAIRKLGRGALIAHAIERAGALPYVHVPTLALYLARFQTATERAAAVQRLLNDGSLATVPGMTPEQIAERMLAGATESELQTEAAAPTRDRQAAWAAREEADRAKRAARERTFAWTNFPDSPGGTAA